MPNYGSAKDKYELLRQLVPKSYHFDGYNELNCPNSRDAPFFSDNSIAMGEHLLNITLVNHDTISLNFGSKCNGQVSFKTYLLTISDYAEKVREAVKSDRDFITLDIKVNYISPNYLKNHRRYDMEYEYKKTYMAAISFNISDMKEALSCYFEITNPNSNSKKGINFMNKKNNFMGINFEYGISKDPNIAATLLGVCVKNPKTGLWYCFDQARNTVKNIICKMGDFPIFLLPARQLEPGCLYKKKDGNYEFVKSIDPATGTVQWIRPIDGVIREALPEESMIPGFNFYTRVTAIDMTSITDPASKADMKGHVLAAMCMMQWNNDNGAEFSIDNIDDSSFNGLGAFMPLLLMNNTGGVPGSDQGMDITTLMALGASMSGDNSQMMQGLILSGLLNGSSANSPLSGIIPGIAPEPKAGASVICHNCNKTYDADTAFCPTCGNKTSPLGEYCKSCGAELKPNSSFCHKCGARVGENICPSCSAVIDSDANFCPKCGKNVHAAAEVAPPKKETGESAKSEATPAAPTPKEDKE